MVKAITVFGSLLLLGLSLGQPCASNEITVTRTDGGLVPLVFCYDRTFLMCKTTVELIGCTECNEGATLSSFTVTKSGTSYTGTLKRCQYATLLWGIILIILGIAVVITLLIIACVCCCCRNKQIYHGGY